MKQLWLAVALALPWPAQAFPTRISKGPVITGVTPSEAWIAWETTAPQGKGAGCLLHHDAKFQISPPVSGQRIMEDPRCSTVHHVHLTGLKPGTRYDLTFPTRYDRKHAAMGQFTTAPSDPAAEFDFVVYGDNRDAPPPQPQTRSNHEAVTSAILRADGDAAFLLHTGDLALNIPSAAGGDRGYGEFFDVERAILSSHPIFAVVGNHETIDMTEYDAFVNPRSFAGDPHPAYSSFDWGRAHFALVDAFEGPITRPEKGDRAPGILSEQAAWLAKDLEEAAGRGQLLFIVSHQSPFSHLAPGAKGHGSSPEVASVIVPLMLKYKVLAVFAGHDHYYERGHEGCIDYFVVGGGGAPMYDPDPNAPGVAVARKVTSYVAVSVRADGVTAVAKSTTGEVLDTVHLAPADGTACAAAQK
jgi:hypothetical protein